MKTPEIKIVYGDDWEGLYIDGELIYENHSLSYQDILNALSVKFDYVEADEEWLEKIGKLPSNIKDVVEAPYI